MSRYLGFVLERAGLPAPAVVWVARHELDWVNRQVYDELTSLLPTAVVTLGQDLRTVPILDMGTLPKSCPPIELAVVPYVESLAQEPERIAALVRLLASSPRLPVFLYGLARREVRIVEASRLAGLYRTERRLRAIESFVRRWRLRRLAAFVCRRLGIH